jgi:hypothetical protein
VEVVASPQTPVRAVEAAIPGVYTDDGTAALLIIQPERHSFDIYP